MPKLMSLRQKRSGRERFPEPEELIPARLGDGAGNVRHPTIPNSCYVEIGGIIDVAYNDQCPAKDGWQVWCQREKIGPRGTPGKLRVVRSRSDTPGGPNGSVGSLSLEEIAAGLEYKRVPGGSNPLWVQGMQIMPLRVGQATGLNVQVQPGVVTIGGGIEKQIAYQIIDLTAHLPATADKAVMILISVDNTGVIAHTAGAEFAFPAGATVDHYLINRPAAPSGTVKELALVRMYSGQTLISEGVGPSNTDFVDLRWSGSVPNPAISAGVYTLPAYTDPADGSVTLGDGTFYTYATTDFDNPLTLTSVPGANYALTDNSVNYVIFTGSTGAITVTTSRASINQSNVIPIYTIYREGNELHILDWDKMAKGLANKISDRLVRTDRFVVETGGLMISEAATRTIITTSGVVWFGAVNAILDAFTSATDSCDLWYHAAGVWTKAAITQYNNTQYDDGTNLQSTAGGKYVVNWVFRGVETDVHGFVVLGTGDYTLSQAQASTIPALPDLIATQAILVGRIIVKQGEAAATEIASAFVVPFSRSPVTEIGELAAIAAYTVVGNNTAGASAPLALTVAQVLTLLGVQPLLVDTRANILATAATVTRVAFATDTARLYIADGTNWYQIVPNGAVIDLPAPDMGYEQDSARTGYGDDYITDKTLSNVLIGGSSRDENGSLRVDVANDPDTLEIYLRAQWNTIIYDLTTQDGDFRHTPLSEQIYIWRGDSVAVGLNGRPVISEYQVSMGAYPPARIIDGGTF